VLDGCQCVAYVFVVDGQACVFWWTRKLEPASLITRAIHAKEEARRGEGFSLVAALAQPTTPRQQQQQKQALAHHTIEIVPVVGMLPWSWGVLVSPPLSSSSRLPTHSTFPSFRTQHTHSLLLFKELVA